MGDYSKHHLWAAERYYFHAGEDIPVFNTKYGKIGVMICYDAGFPEVARILALKGAELILCPSAWRVQDWDVEFKYSAKSVREYSLCGRSKSFWT